MLTAVSASAFLISVLGVRMTRRLVMRLAATLFTSATESERSPNRMLPSPGTATLWPSVAHALMTSPMASHAALMEPLLMPERRAASWITLSAVSLL